MNATLLVSSTDAATSLPSGEMYTPSGDSPRSMRRTTLRLSMSTTRSALFGWSETYARRRAAWIAVPRGLPPVLISPTTSSRPVSMSEIVPPFSLPTRARPAKAGTAMSNRSERIVLGMFISLEDREVAHHHAILVLEVVAVEHVALPARERGAGGQREVDAEPDGLVRPDEHRILHAEVRCEARAAVRGEAARRPE